jgi:hypothetical protein
MFGLLLRALSKDGNILVSAAPFWPRVKIIFMPNDTLYTLNPEKCTVIFEDYEIKATIIFWKYLYVGQLV